MLPDAFLSVVAKPGDNRLTVRARVRADLERFREHCALGPIRENAGTDYRYRAHATRAAFADALATIAIEINYANFKSEVLRTLGPNREATYHRIWSILLHELRDEPAFRNPGLDSDLSATPRPRRGRRRRRS